MAVEVSITRRSNDQSLSSFNPSYTIKTKAKKPLRLPAFFMIGAGILILGYLGFSFIAGKPQDDLEAKEEVKEVLGITEGKETTTSFGDLYSLNSSNAPNASPQPNPGPNITQSNLSTFGKILGLKEENLPNREVLSEFTITIPALGIKDAKVLTNVDGTNESIYQNILKEAIAHFLGSAFPGERGNVFLFGHSMLPILARGEYQSIFTNLPKLKKGDVIFVEYGDDSLRYLIEQTAVVNPKDVFVLRQPQSEELLTLMTCIPPGFGSDRFVAIAKRN